MRILDRYIIKSFLVNYLLALGVLVGMFVLFDLIVNFDKFAKSSAQAAAASSLVGSATGASSTTPPAAPTSAGASAISIIADMVDYYAYQLLVIFQLVSGAIPTLAAGFTMVRMTRHHELTAMLASGVSLYRVAAPIVLVSTAIAGLHVVNQEFVISQPYIIEKLLRKQGDVAGTVIRSNRLDFVKDGDSLLSAREYDPSQKQMKDVFIVQRDEYGNAIRHWVAKTATWELPAGQLKEAWVMREVTFEDDDRSRDPRKLEARKPETLIYSTNLTPEQLDLIFQKKAVDYLSSAQVHKLIAFSPDINKPALYKIMHLRFTQPLMNLIMLLIGIPFLLTREPNRLVVNMFYCTAVSGLVFITTFVIFQMSGTQLDPLLSAWLPVLIFAPVAVLMMDFIQT